MDRVEARRIPAGLVWLAAFACAFAHAGLWAREGLSGPCCARCRALIAPAILLGALLVLGTAGFLVRLWLRRRL